MRQIIKQTLIRNGNGVAAINARGISHRGWSRDQGIAGAADAVLGITHVVPTIGQATNQYFVTPAEVTAELKARAITEKLEARTAAEVATDATLAIVNAWDIASAKEQAEAIRIVGPACVWDALASVID